MIPASEEEGALRGVVANAREAREVIKQVADKAYWIAVLWPHSPRRAMGREQGEAGR